MNIEYPFFAISGKSLNVEINETFKGNENEKVIGIFDQDNKQYSICLKDNSISLKDIMNGDSKESSTTTTPFKEFKNICKHEKKCEMDGKLINDTVFVSCFHDDQMFYNYTIINLKNDSIKISKDYNYGRAFPISNQVINEWSRVKLPAADGSGRLIDLIKVDAFNFVTGVGQFVCCFPPLEKEMFLQISTSLDFKQLFVLSNLNGNYIFSIRNIIENEAIDLTQFWDLGGSIYSVTIQEPYIMLFSSAEIIVYNISTNKPWYVNFQSPVEHVDGESFLYLNIWDINNGVPIKSLKVDASKYSKSRPPISITPIGDAANLSSFKKLLILNNDKEIHSLNFS